jgi:hypothetical protein
MPPLVELQLVNRHWADATVMGMLALAAWLLFDRNAIGRSFIVRGFITVVLRVANLWRPSTPVALVRCSGSQPSTTPW